MLLLLSRIIVGQFRLRAITRQGFALEDDIWQSLVDEERRAAGVSRNVRVFVTPVATAPLTWGTSRPVILLPEEALEWSEDLRKLVVRHELAHIARRDTM